MARQRAVRAGHRWQPDVGSQRRRTTGGVTMRRTKASLMRGSGIALLAVVAAAVGAGGWWLAQSPLLAIDSVTVEGNARVDTQTVLDTATLEGQNIIRADLDAATERLEALAEVSDASIERDWPKGVTITIVERAPVAVWQVGDQRYVIDQKGVVLDLPAPEGAPVIVQTDIPREPIAAGTQVDEGALAVAQRLLPSAEQTLGRAVTALEFTQASGLTAVLDGGLRVTFGDARAYDFKIAALFAVLQRADEHGRTVRSVDLRFPERVAVQWG